MHMHSKDAQVWYGYVYGKNKHGMVKNNIKIIIIIKRQQRRPPHHYKEISKHKKS